MNETTAIPEVQGQTETSRAVMRGALDTMRNAASEASQAIENGGATVRALENGKVVQLASAEDEQKHRAAVIEKVGRFLDVKLHGPMFIGTARGKLFIGEYPRQQDILDVQVLVGNKPTENLSVGQLNVAVIDELRKVLFGWIPVTSPKAQLLRAHIDQRQEWERLGIKLQPVEWMASRDPYVMEREVRPLWEQYAEWKTKVEPTQDDLDFYYGLM